jgi:hypothetical protein
VISERSNPEKNFPQLRYRDHSIIDIVSKPDLMLSPQVRDALADSPVTQACQRLSEKLLQEKDAGKCEAIYPARKEAKERTVRISKTQ